MKEGISGKSIYRKDYMAYPWDVNHLDIHFDIGSDTTTVRAVMEFQLKDATRASQDIVLTGHDLQLMTMSLNGQLLSSDDYAIEGETLTISNAPPKSVVETEVRIHPSSNSALEGLYVSGSFLLTQCEAQGFRKITWFPDRPDVMTRYRVTLEAEKSEFPILLSNGNQKGSADIPGVRHWDRW